MDARSRASSTQNTSADTHKYFVGRIYLYFVSKNISYLDFTFSWQFIVCTPDAPSSPIIIFCYILSLDLYVFAASVFFFLFARIHIPFSMFMSLMMCIVLCVLLLCVQILRLRRRVWTECYELTHAYICSRILDCCFCTYFCGGPADVSVFATATLSFERLAPHDSMHTFHSLCKHCTVAAIARCPVKPTQETWVYSVRAKLKA